MTEKNNIVEDKFAMHKSLNKISLSTAMSEMLDVAGISDNTNVRLSPIEYLKGVYEKNKNLTPDQIERNLERETNLIGVQRENRYYHWPMSRALKDDLPLEKIKMFAPKFPEELWGFLKKSSTRSAKKHADFINDVEVSMLRDAFMHPDKNVLIWLVNEYYPKPHQVFLNGLLTNLVSQPDLKKDLDWFQRMTSFIGSSTHNKKSQVEAMFNWVGDELVDIWTDMMKNQPDSKYNMGVFLIEKNKKAYLEKTERLFYEVLPELSPQAQARMVDLLKISEQIHLERKEPLYKDRLNAVWSKTAESFMPFGAERLTNTASLAKSLVTWLKRQEMLESFGLSNDLADMKVNMVSAKENVPPALAGTINFGQWESSNKRSVIQRLVAHGLANTKDENLYLFLGWLGRLVEMRPDLKEGLVVDLPNFKDEARLKLLYMNPDFWSAWRDEHGNNILRDAPIRSYFYTVAESVSGVRADHAQRYFFGHADEAFKEKVGALLFAANQYGQTPLDQLRHYFEFSKNSQVSVSDKFDVNLVEAWLSEQLKVGLSLDKKLAVQTPAPTNKKPSSNRI